MHLKTIINQLRDPAVEGSAEREITGITYDSRRVTPGMLFVAVPGQTVDGHDYIHHAIDRGAAAVICERDSFVAGRAVKILTPDAREALALAAAAYYEMPGSKLKIIGVTGTNGKTTVAFMIKRILETAGIKTGLMGTIRYEIGERVIPAHRTTPEALEIQQLLASMVRSGCQACVMEVSSHALEQKRVHGLEFDAAIFTNLTQDHLDYHGTMESYFASKRRLFEAVENGSRGGGAVINIDDEYGRRLAAGSKIEVQLTYGLGEAAKLRATKIQLDKKSTRMLIQTPEHQFTCNLPLIGRHNIYNALAAVGAGLVLKVGTPVIRAALNAMEPVPGRLEAVPGAHPFGVYIDYAHTDDALRNVLQTLREITPGRILLTFGCGGNRDAGKRSKMGRVAAELADFTIVTSDNPRKEDPARIAAEIEIGFGAAENTGYRIELDRRRAIEEVIRLARPGDSVLIAGKGHETYQEFQDTIVPFDDRVYAMEALELLAKGDRAREAAPVLAHGH